MSFCDGLVRVAGAALGLAPRRHRMAAAGALAFAAAEGVVDRVHGHAAGLGADALPAVAAGLADADQLGLGVADLAEGGPAVDGHPAHLGGGQPQGGVVALLGHQLDAHAGAAGHLAAAARLELDVVHDRADRDVAHRQGVARPDLGALTAAQHVADLDPGRGQDVALLAVVVVEQGDAGVAVGVVLDGGHRGRHAVLVALEIDDAVLLLVAAAAVAGRLAAVGVAAAGPGLGASSVFSGRVLVISLKSETVWNRRPGLVGLRLRRGMVGYLRLSSRTAGSAAPRRGSRSPAWCRAACRRSACGGGACACPCG